VQVRLGDDLEQRHARPVQVDERIGLPVALDVGELAGVLL
jgi:hypothetical protein